MTTRIIGTGSFLPKNIVTNDDLSKIMDTSDEWIRTRTGIRERHLVKEESTTYMAVEAAKKALENAGMEAGELDLIIVATITGDHITPSTACEVQAQIGAKGASAFDLNAACSGFLFALNTAHAYIMSGFCKNALIIGVETLSKIMDWKDRSTCVLFGDGAGAAVLTRDEKGLLGFDWGTDGAKGMVLACKNRESHNPLVIENLCDSDSLAADIQMLDYVKMDGQEVYKFAVSTVPVSIGKALDMAGLNPEDIKYFALHQANLRILQSVAKRLKVEQERFPVSLDHCGNISAASVPILLDEMNRQGLLERGDRIVLSGFGGGLTWGSAVLEW